MARLLTGILVFCAATTLAAWAVAAAKLRIENGKCRIAELPSVYKKRANPQFSILHSTFSINTAVFVFFAAIATLSAQKTNSPPRGGNVELKMENVELRNPSFVIENEPIHHSTFSILHSQFASQFPSNAVLHDKWWKRGAWEDVLRVHFPNGWVFPFGEDHLTFVDVMSQGSLRRRWRRIRC